MVLILLTVSTLKKIHNQPVVINEYTTRASKGYFTYGAEPPRTP